MKYQHSRLFGGGVRRVIRGVVSVRQYLQDESAVTAVEYGLIAGGIALAILAVIFNLGEDLANLFQGITDTLAQGR